MLQALLALGLCFVPLFDLLGYEFALATGAVATLSGVLVGLRTARAHPEGFAVTSAWLWAVLHLLPGLAIISLNALWVRNCDYREGLGFFLLLPVPTALYASTLGLLIGRVCQSWHRALRFAVAGGVLLCPLMWTLWQLYDQPPIFAFDHLWGHFAGSLYDEVISLDSRLLLFRTGTALRVAAAALFGVLWQRRSHVGRPHALLAAAAGLFAIVAYEGLVGPRAGFRVSRANIEETLPVVVERPGLVIHLPRSATAEQRQQIADDHVFRLEGLSRRLAVQPKQPIHSYLYANAAQKARLMGGRATMLARPWRHEIHIHGLRTPHRVLAHELVHALAGEFGSPVLKVSARYGFIVNMTLVEGLAEALAPPRGALDLHASSRAIRELGLAPDIQSLMGPAGFWQAAPRRAYTVAGSFVSYLLERFGPEPLKRAYPRGDFEAAYGKPLEELVAQWESHLDALPLSRRDARIAQEQFRRKSIFARPCAHEISQLRAHARRAQPQAALELHRRITKHLPGDPSAQLGYAMALLRAGETQGFRSEAQRLLGNDRLDPAGRARLLEKLGEELWKEGELGEAYECFDEVMVLRPGANSDRMQWVRKWGLKLAPEPREQIRRFLGGELAPLAASLALSKLEDPASPTYAYLVARQLHRVGAYSQALDALRLARGHPFAAIEAERIRLVADTLWRLGRLDQAEDVFGAYADQAPTSGERARALDWQQRIRWTAANGL